MTIGDRIRSKRLAKKLTQAELARLVGMSQSSLSELERGESKMPNAINIQALANTLEVSQNWILTGQDGDLRYPTHDEAAMLEAISKLTAEQQVAVYTIIKGMSED